MKDKYLQLFGALTVSAMWVVMTGVALGESVSDWGERADAQDTTAHHWTLDFNEKRFSFLNSKLTLTCPDIFTL